MLCGARRVAGAGPVAKSDVRCASYGMVHFSPSAEIRVAPSRFRGTSKCSAGEGQFDAFLTIRLAAAADQVMPSDVCNYVPAGRAPAFPSSSGPPTQRFSRPCMQPFCACLMHFVNRSRLSPPHKLSDLLSDSMASQMIARTAATEGVALTSRLHHSRLAGKLCTARKRVAAVCASACYWSDVFQLF